MTGPNARAIVAKLMTERPTSLRVVRDVVPRSLDDAVMRALAKAPTDRFSSAREFADALTATEAAATSRRRAGARRVAAHDRARPVGVDHRRRRVHGGVTRRHATAPHRRGDADAPPSIRSIAVLPLDNYSGDSTQDYFAEGMTDELTTDARDDQPAARHVARFGDAVQGQEPPADARRSRRRSMWMPSSRARWPGPATRCGSPPS